MLQYAFILLFGGVVSTQGYHVPGAVMHLYEHQACALPFPFMLVHVSSIVI